MKEVLNLLKFGQVDDYHMESMRITGTLEKSVKHSEMRFNIIKRAQRKLLSGISVATFLFLAGTASGQIAATTKIDPSCNEKFDGSITVTISGSGPFQFVLDSSGVVPTVFPPSITTNPYTFSNLSGKDYTVYVKDGATTYNTSLISLKGILSTATIINVNCKSDKTGSISLSTPQNGVSPYTYLWSPGAQTTDNITNQLAGNYQVTITDNASKTCVKKITISEPTTILSTSINNLNVQNPSCDNATDGYITVTAAGGTTPYLYSWNTSPVQTNATANNLGVDTFSVIVTDANNCKDTATRILINSDATAPVAKTKNIVVDLDNTGNVTITPAQVNNGTTDNCAFKLSLDKTKFSCADTGIAANKVILTAVDSAGNSDTAHAYVRVRDVTAPKALPKYLTKVYLDNNGEYTLMPSETDSASTDNCSIKSITIFQQAWTCRHLGLDSGNFEVTDYSNNKSNKIIRVLVLDTTRPAMTVQNATISIDTAGNALLTQGMVVISISDNCATDQVIISKTLFGLADVGDNNVDITLTDKSGNLVKKTVKVTVVIGDSDNDGIPDHIEKGGDFDGDGTKDYLDEDSDNDGLADKLENNNGAILVDSDVDTRPDYKDLDSDNDGINDVREAGLADADQNGLKDNASDLLFASVDTDGDGVGNQRELDSDNDNIFDLAESLQAYTDANADGIADGTDTDGDGIIDNADGSAAFGDAGDAVPADTDSDNAADYIDTDSDNDTIPDSIEGTVDTDSDNLPNYRDTDSDDDTILDSYEAKDGNNPIDTDNDGKKDYVDTDSDNDLIPDKVEAGANPASPVNTDGDNLENYRDVDSDGDKIPDTEEAGADPTNPVDTDSDGKQDYMDLDSDGDTIPDEVEAGADRNNPIDTDGDGDEDYRDLDSDNDGIDDKTEAGADPTKPVDTDGDGIMDFRDTDSDNDEVLDSVEGTKDSDGNTIPDYRDAEVIIPEAFSPNGDGDNDEFYIKGLKVFDKAELIVFNRNGQVVYQSGSSYNNKWDGTYIGSIPSLGKDLPEGVYFYVFKYNGQKREPITGNFYIKR